MHVQRWCNLEKINSPAKWMLSDFPNYLQRLIGRQSARIGNVRTGSHADVEPVDINAQKKCFCIVRNNP